MDDPKEMLNKLRRHRTDAFVSSFQAIVLAARSEGLIPDDTIEDLGRKCYTVLCDLIRLEEHVTLLHNADQGIKELEDFDLTRFRLAIISRSYALSERCNEKSAQLCNLIDHVNEEIDKCLSNTKPFETTSTQRA